MAKFLTNDRQEHIKNKANSVLKKYGCGDKRNLLFHIARDNDIEVMEADLYEISGALRKENNNWRIYINRQDSPTRQRFTLAHELGHYFMHRDKRPEFIDGGFVMQRMESSKYEEEELEANEFAGNLIMPETEISERLEGARHITTQNVVELAKEFRVSTLAMATRLRNIGYEVPNPEQAA